MWFLDKIKSVAVAAVSILIFLLFCLSAYLVFIYTYYELSYLLLLSDYVVLLTPLVLGTLVVAPNSCQAAYVSAAKFAPTWKFNEHRNNNVPSEITFSHLTFFTCFAVSFHIS